MLKRKLLSKENILIPADVPGGARDIYRDNFLMATKSTGYLAYLSALENNEIWYDNSSEFLFKLASNTKVNCLCLPVGLITLYANDYSDILYLAKMNFSDVMADSGNNVNEGYGSFGQILEMINNDIRIMGIVCTVDVEIGFKLTLIPELAQCVYNAHKNGLFVVLNVVGKCQKKDKRILAKFLRLGVRLGFDYVQLNHDILEDKEEKALGSFLDRCKMLRSFSEKEEKFLELSWKYVNEIGSRGVVIRSNISSTDIEKSEKFINAVASVLYAGDSLENSKEVNKTGVFSNDFKEFEDRLSESEM